MNDKLRVEFEVGISTLVIDRLDSTVAEPQTEVADGLSALSRASFAICEDDLSITRRVYSSSILRNVNLPAQQAVHEIVFGPTAPMSVEAPISSMLQKASSFIAARRLPFAFAFALLYLRF